jgi:hypothetical protein
LPFVTERLSWSTSFDSSLSYSAIR